MTEKRRKKGSRPEFNFNFVKFSAGFVTVIFVTVVFYNLNVKPTLASLCFVDGFRYEKKDVKKSYSNYIQGIQKNTIYDSDLKMAFIDRSLFLLSNNLADPIKGEVINQLIRLRLDLHDGLQKKDQQVKNRYQFLYLVDEQTYLFSKDSRYFDNMEADLKEAMDFNPEFNSFYQLESEMKILEGKTSEGEALMKKAEGLNLWSDNPAVNKTGYFDALAAAYYKARNPQKTIENLENELDADYAYKKSTSKSTYDSPSKLLTVVNALAFVYISDLKSPKGASETFQKAMEAYPEHKQVFEFYLNNLLQSYPHPTLIP